MKRIRTPTRIQMEAVECGAVALAIILEYHGHISTVEELREACGVSRDGVRAGKIVRAAREYGLLTEGLQVEMEDLDALPLPAILHWEFDHFVVLEGLGGDYVHINDPATGPRRVTRAEVDVAFTGVALSFEPGPDFRRTPARASLLSVAMERLRSVQPALVISALASLTLLFPNLLVPAFSGVFTDHILIRKHTDWLWPLLITMLVVALMSGWMTWQREQYLLRAQTKLAAGGNLNYFWHALTLPMRFYHQRYAAEIANRASLNDSVSGTLAHSIAGVALGLFSMVVYAVIMMQYDVRLTLLALAFAGISVLSLYISQRLLADTHRRELMEQSKLAAIVNRGLSGLSESTASGTSDLVFGQMVGQHGAMISRRQASLRNSFMLQALQRCLATLALVAVLVQGGYDIMAGAITVGMMMAFQGLMNLLSAPITQLISAGASLQDVRGNLERLDDVIRHPRDPAFDLPFPANAEQVKPCMGDIEFRNLTFGYSKDMKPLLENFSLRIAQGTSVAIVGESGCGKSTLTRLLVSHLQPWSGDILIGGESLHQVPRARRFRSVAHVDQDVRLLSGPLRDNLTLWDTTISAKTLAQAMRDTGLEEVVAKRAGGLSSTVLEGGRNLSGGERQRMDIARAIAKDTPILVLDEATSALEPPLERRIIESLIAQHKTLILASHRTAPLALFDRIIVMDQGRIVQDGEPADLAAVAGPFRTLMEM